jgi:flagellar hook assembly protein FlgD
VVYFEYVAFHRTTGIAYNLPRTSEVSLKVYEISGRLVRTLVSGTQDAGYLSLSWDGRDEVRHLVSEGVYFVRMETPEYTATKELVLLR